MWGYKSIWKLANKKKLKQIYIQYWTKMVLYLYIESYIVGHVTGPLKAYTFSQYAVPAI